MQKINSAVAAIGSLLTVGASWYATPVLSADKASVEKCYGVSKAGKNDCAGTVHACSGQAKTDADPKDFIEVPKGTCGRLAGGSLTPK